MSEPARSLGPNTEAWLRRHIKIFGPFRDQAVAAGLIDPAMPVSNAQAKVLGEIEAIRQRVVRRLNKPKE